VKVAILSLALDANEWAFTSSPAPEDIDAVLPLSGAAIVLNRWIAEGVFEQEAGAALEGLPIFRSRD
jgi:hypothetical protein